MARPSRTGVTVKMMREEYLDGLPVYAGPAGIPTSLIERSILAAESRVEKQTDIILSPATVYCRKDQTRPTPAEGERIIMRPALTKPANWFSGNRFGALKLPVRPLNKIKKVRLLPYGPMALPFELEDGKYVQFRPVDNFLRFLPGVTGMLFGIDAAIFTQPPYNVMQIPGGIEVEAEAGLSKELLEDEFDILISMTMLAAASLILTAVQARMGGGVQKEQLVQDGLSNTVEYARRDKGGPLAGEIATFEAQYDELLSAVTAGRAPGFAMFQ
jgi:hypothetical protein